MLGPNITGNFALGDPGAWLSVAMANGAFTSGEGVTGKANHEGSGYSQNIFVNFDAKNYNPIYDNSQTVQPSSLVFNYIIKY
jgi:hypothetical protein